MDGLSVAHVLIRFGSNNQVRKGQKGHIREPAHSTKPMIVRSLLNVKTKLYEKISFPAYTTTQAEVDREP